MLLLLLLNTDVKVIYFIYIIYINVYTELIYANVIMNPHIFTYTIHMFLHEPQFMKQL